MQSGIVVMLDDKKEYDELKEDIKTKFIQSAKFLGKADIGISFEGRKLTDTQIKEILEIVKDNTELNVVCVLTDNKEQDAAYRKLIEKNLQSIINKKKADEGIINAENAATKYKEFVQAINEMSNEDTLIQDRSLDRVEEQ